MNIFEAGQAQQFAPFVDTTTNDIFEREEAYVESKPSLIAWLVSGWRKRQAVSDHEQPKSAPVRASRPG